MTRSLALAAQGIATGMLWCLFALPCRAQESRTNDLRATVANVGAILAVSPLEPGAREPSGDIHVSGTVTTRQNGPYELQVRLTSLFAETPGGGRGRSAGGGTAVVNEVRALLPGGAYQTLDTVNWVTIATGPGAASTLNPVVFLIVWGQGSSKSPSLAVTIPVEYRVVPP